MALTEAQRYSGVVSSHSWSTPDVIPRIYKLGGVITPMQDQAPGWLKQYAETKAQAKPDSSTSASATARTRTALRGRWPRGPRT